MPRIETEGVLLRLMPAELAAVDVARGQASRTAWLRGAIRMRLQEAGLLPENLPAPARKQPA